MDPHNSLCKTLCKVTLSVLEAYLPCFAFISRSSGFDLALSDFGVFGFAHVVLFAYHLSVSLDLIHEFAL